MAGDGRGGHLGQINTSVARPAQPAIEPADGCERTDDEETPRRDGEPKGHQVSFDVLLDGR